LEGTTTIDGKEYLNLNVVKKKSTDISDPNIVGYIRTERGDTVVYARYVDEKGVVTDEFVLYDFGSFEQGTSMQYSAVNDGDSDDIMQCTEIIDGDSLSYYHDVIEDGDTLPCYHDIIFKVGHVGGPLYLINGWEMEIMPPGPGDVPPDSTPKPKRKNISHTVLKLADRTVTLLPDGSIHLKTVLPSVCAKLVHQ
jgi:hypothetical protein